MRLIDAVAQWLEGRNKFVHALVKSMPGEPSEQIQDFLLLAEKSAKEGAKLTRKVCDWHKAQLNASKKSKG